MTTRFKQIIFFAGITVSGCTLEQRATVDFHEICFNGKIFLHFESSYGAALSMTDTVCDSNYNWIGRISFGEKDKD